MTAGRVSFSDFRAWKSDGTAAGTREWVGFYPGLGLVRGSIEVGRKLFFFGAEAQGGPLRLFSSDGTRAGTRLIANYPDSAPFDTGRLIVAADRVYLLGPHGLWVSNGAEQGTRALVTDFSPFHTFRQLTPLGRGLLLGASTFTSCELWRTNGSRRSTGPVRELYPEPCSFGSPYADGTSASLGGRVVFTVHLGTSQDRVELWTTDGTAAATFRLAEICSDGCTSGVPLEPFDGELYFFGRDPQQGTELWRSDGTAAGTFPLTDLSSSNPFGVGSSPSLGGRAVFGRRENVGIDQTSRLWSTDGTSAGTRLLDVLPAPFRIEELTSVGHALYFCGFEPTEGAEIWTSDGTAPGTRRLTHFEEPFPSTVEPDFTPVGGRVLFRFQGELWVSDGTAAGTFSLSPLIDTGIDQPSDLVLWQDQVWFLAFHYDPTSSEWLLARTDGTPEGTRRVAALGPARAEGLTPWGDQLSFRVLSEDGSTQLWLSDGTIGGTRAVTTIGGWRSGEQMVAAGNRLLFLAGRGGGYEEGDLELAVSDGTAAGTRRVQDIFSGRGSSQPHTFASTPSRLYFTADDGLHGRELWSLDLDALRALCRPGSHALCLGEGRFRAELFWQDGPGERGDGQALTWSSDSGAFAFYDSANPEAVLKVVDGRALNDAFWLFYGPLTDAYVALTVTDVLTGEARRYPQQLGPLGPFVDGALIPTAGPASGTLEPSTPAAVSGPCIASTARLCLHDGRFALELFWQDEHGAEHPARAFSHSGLAGYFAFESDRHVEAAAKLLDGRAVNGHFWLFETVLTHRGTRLTVTDTTTGEVRVLQLLEGGVRSFQSLDLF